MMQKVLKCYYCAGELPQQDHFCLYANLSFLLPVQKFNFVPLRGKLIAAATWSTPYQRSISTSDPQELDNEDTEHSSVSNTSGKLQQILYKSSEESFDVCY